MKHLPTILCAILAVVFLVLYITKPGPVDVPDNSAEIQRLNKQVDSLRTVVQGRRQRELALSDSIADLNDKLNLNQDELDKIKNRKPYAAPVNIVDAASEWDSIFAAHGIPGHAYLLYPRAK